MKVITKKDACYLLGTGAGLENTPWDKEDIDYIACYPVLTQPCAFGHRIDIVFELHEQRQWEEWKVSIEQFIKKNPKSFVFMQKAYLEGTKEFPLFEIQKMAKNKYLKKYFTSSIAFMMAYAIYAGYKKIYLYGIQLSVEEEEYSMQRGCFEAWMAYAIAKNIDVEIMTPSALMNINYMYGYEGNKDFQIKLVNVKEALIEARDVLKKQSDNAAKDLAQQEGGLILIDKLIKMYR